MAVFKFSQLEPKPAVPMCMACGNTRTFIPNPQRMECNHKGKSDFQMLRFVSLEFTLEIDQYHALFCCAAVRTLQPSQIYPKESSTSYDKIPKQLIVNYYCGIKLEVFDPWAKSVAYFRESKYQTVKVEVNGDIEALR